MAKKHIGFAEQATIAFMFTDTKEMAQVYMNGDYKEEHIEKLVQLRWLQNGEKTVAYVSINVLK